MGAGLQRARAAAKATQRQAADREKIEAAFTGWWNGTVRHGMTASEAGRTLMEALNAAGLLVVSR